MTSQAFTDTTPAIIGILDNAETATAAAQSVIDYLGVSAQTIIVLLPGGSTPIDIITAADQTPDSDFINWLYSSPDWYVWQEPQTQGGFRCLPLRFADCFYGLVCFTSDPPADLPLVVTLLAARLHHLYREQKWSAMLSDVNEIGRILSNYTGEQTWTEVHEYICSLFDTTSFFITLYDREQDVLSFPLVSHDNTITDTEPMPLAGLSKAVINYALELYFSDVPNDGDRLAKLNTARHETEPGSDARSWMGAPLRNRKNEVIGLISLHNEFPNHFSDQDLTLLMTIATQLSGVLDSETLRAIERERRTFTQVMMDMSQLVGLETASDDVLDRILEQLHRMVDFDSASILMPAPGSPDGKRMRLQATLGPLAELNGAEIEFSDNSLVMQVFQERAPYVLSDVRDHPGWQPIPHDAFEQHTRAWIAAPMVAHDRVIGVITVERFVADYYDDRDASNIFALARQAAIIIENMRLHAATRQNLKALERRTKRLTSMQQVVSIITSTLDQDTVLSSTAQLLTELFGVNHCSILLLDELQHYLFLTTEYPDWGNAGQRVAIETSQTVKRLMEYKTALAIYDAGDDTEVDVSLRQLLGRIGTQSVLYAPLTVRDRVIGMIGLDATARPRQFTEEERSTFMTIAGQVALAIHNANLYEQAIENVRLKSEFMANITHELRTPLNAIIGYSDMLLSQIYGEINEKQTDRLQRVHTSGRHLLDLIDDVMALAKIKAGSFELSKMPLYVSDLLTRLNAEFSPRAEERDLELAVDVATDEPLINADSERLHRILWNLFDNAIKFTHEGGVTVKVRPVRLPNTYPDESEMAQFLSKMPGNLDLVAGQWLGIAIQDTGIGIKPEDQLIIFDSFRQVDGSSVREYGGSGLGLALVQQLIQIHGGHIWVDSAEQQGSTFTILMPVLSAEANAAAQTPG